MQGKLWAKATKTAAVLGKLPPTTHSTDEQFNDNYPFLIIYGAQMEGKFKGEAVPIVMIGNGENHSKDVNHMYMQ